MGILQEGWSTLFTRNPTRLHLVLPLGFTLGIVETWIFFPLLQRLTPLLREWRRLHYKPIADIPGVPEHYDWALICALRTVPDPHNFLGVYSQVPLARGVKMRVRMPRCTYFSLSLYPGMFDPKQDVVPPSLADHEVAYNDDGSFNVVLSETRPQGSLGRNWLPAQGVRDGMLVFRRYGVPEGVRVFYPEMRRLDDNTLLKPAYTTVTGAYSAETTINHRYHRVLRICCISLVVGVALMVSPWRLRAWEVDVVLAIAAAMVIAMNSLFWAIGSRRAKQLLHAKTEGCKHVAIEPTLEFGNQSARPHPMHKYYVFEYDATDGDVVITGVIPLRKLKFWSLVLYDWYGMPLTQNYSHETIIASDHNQSRGRVAEHEIAEKDEMAYTVVLTCGRERAVEECGVNALDVSCAPTGVGMLRVIYPSDDDAFARARPDISVRRATQSQSKKDE